MKKLIFMILDGLNYETSKEMGYLNALAEGDRASFIKVEAALPSLSRPLYETLLTGLAPIDHGIVSNQSVRLSREENIFSLARARGLKTAAAAYHWVSELYNKAPFDYVEDIYTEDEGMNIQYGKFYYEDHYPDNHLILDAENLRRRYSPDFLLIHPMNIDDAGHKFGSDSREYRNSARNMDNILSQFVPRWVDEGYTVIVTSDHGMNRDRTHGGISKDEREVPFFLIGSELNIESKDAMSQLQIAPLICRILGIERGSRMQELDEKIMK